MVTACQMLVKEDYWNQENKTEMSHYSYYSMQYYQLHWEPIVTKYRTLWQWRPFTNRKMLNVYVQFIYTGLYLKRMFY